jgi:3-hydroxyacyl-[acyl-carrier-protein] dehydratase
MRWFWLDRFTEFVSGGHATAIKGVTLSEDHLHDHWHVYPIMPHSLIAEGMAQASGLLVSEAYRFQELVVLAKFSRCTFEGEVHPGDVLTYRARIEQINENGASATVTGHVGERLQAQTEVFFARLSSQDLGRDDSIRLFNPAHLLHWLRLVRVFDVGVSADGKPLREEDYEAFASADSVALF